MANKKWIHIVAFILVLVGALNTFLIGFVPADVNGTPFNIIELTFGFNGIVRDIVYTLIAASTVFLIATHVKDCKTCGTHGVQKAA